MMVSFLKGFKEVQEKKKFNTPPLKRVLRGLGVLHFTTVVALQTMFLQ
jgi:hypothetical protein